MTNLVPGVLFITPGLNHNSTPTPPTISPQELTKKYGREPFNGRPWPYDSPVPRVYDVKNTSTKMIILNNKYGKKSTHLRGYTPDNSKKEDRSPNPERHERVWSSRNPHRHEPCLDSSSPYFEPEINLDLGWLVDKERPPSSYIGEVLYRCKSSVNPKRHTSCLVPSDPIEFHAGVLAPKHHKPFHPPPSFFTSYPDLPLGEKLYMWTISRIYSSTNMKRLKQQQYIKLLETEVRKGYHGFGDYARYDRYIRSQRKQQYQVPSQYAHIRAQSAPTLRAASSRSSSPSKTDEYDRDARPKTSSSRTRQNIEKRDTSPKQMKPKPPSSPSKTPKSPTSSVRSAGRTGSKPTSAKSKTDTGKMTTAKKEDNSDSSLTDKEEKHFTHKEGVDRPKSRLGHVSPRAKSPRSTKDVEKETEQTKDVEKETEQTEDRKKSMDEALVYPTVTKLEMDKEDKFSLHSKTSADENKGQTSGEKVQTSGDNTKGDKDIDVDVAKGDKSKEDDSKSDKSSSSSSSSDDEEEKKKGGQDLSDEEKRNKDPDKLEY